MSELDKILRAMAAHPSSGGIYSVTDSFLLDASGGDSHALMLLFEELVRTGRAREKSIDGYTIELVDFDQPISSEPRRVGGRVLVVDDDHDVREALVDVLEDGGYRTTTAGNGKEAIERLRAGERPTVILLELKMPVMNGYEFRDAQTADPELLSIPVVLLSAHDDVRAAVRQLGVAAGLQKPFPMAALLETVGRLCGPPSDESRP